MKQARNTPARAGGDDRFRKITGALTLGLAAYLLLAFASYLFTWKADQAAALSYGWGLLFTDDVAVANWLGPLGAVVSHVAFYSGFGATSFLFVYLLTLTGLAILRRRPLAELQRQLRWGLVGLMGLSVMLAFAFQMFDFPMGGAYGYLVSSWLERMVGVPGVVLLFLIAVVMVMIWLFDPTWADVRSGELLRRVELKPALPGGLQRFVGGDADALAAGASPGTSQRGVARGRSRSDRSAPVGRDRPRAATLAEAPGPDALPTPKPNARPARKPRLTADDFDLEIDLGGDAPAAATPAPPTGADAPAPPPLGDAQQLELRVSDPEARALPDGELPPDAPAATELTTDSAAALAEAPVVDVPAEAAEPPAAADDDDLALDLEPAPRDVLEAEADTRPEDLGPYDPHLDARDYRYPELELLREYPENDNPVSYEELQENKRQIVDVLLSFDVEIIKISATVGPTITLYEVTPARGVRISKISRLSNDIALNLAALGIRIIAPIPGRGSIGIEVPNKVRQMVPLRDVLASERYREAQMELPIALGKTISNETMVVDLAKMPHLLVAGATGQGKSVGINTIIMSLLYRKHPSEVKLVMVDPKKVELSLYGSLARHFLTYMPGEDEPIITDNDKVINTLNSLCIEMDQRYELLKSAQVRHVTEYNRKFCDRRLNPDDGHKYMPYIVVIIDEFADLIMTAGKDIETPIARIAQLARAVGIHLIIATQRPTVKIITGTIKANFPARLAFKVTSGTDSKTILDSPGAEQLVGMGDMLLSMGADNVRVQCAFVDTPEVSDVIDYINAQQGLHTPYLLPEYIGDDGETEGLVDKLTPQDADPLMREAAHMVVDNCIGSTSMLQRRMKIGYNRAGRIMDHLCQLGVVGEGSGSKPRPVHVSNVAELEHMLDLFFGDAQQEA